jgi:hypothetical protein
MFPTTLALLILADQAVVGSFSTVFDPRSVGDLRFHIADRRVVVRTNDANGPGIDIAGLVNFGRPYDGNGRRTETHRQVSHTFSRSVGHHLWKAGATVNRVHLDANMADGFGATYVFASLADFASGSFAAEQRGAERVLATDSFIWKSAMFVCGTYRNIVNGDPHEEPDILQNSGSGRLN